MVCVAAEQYGRIKQYIARLRGHNCNICSEILDHIEGVANDMRLDINRLVAEREASERGRVEAIARAEKLADKLDNIEAERLRWFGDAEDFAADLAEARNNLQAAERDRRMAHDQAREQCEAARRARDECNTLRGELELVSKTFEAFRREAAAVRDELAEARLDHLDQVLELLDVVGRLTAIIRDQAGRRSAASA